MGRLLMRRLLCCIWFFILPSQVMADALLDAQHAFEAGDYARAATLYLPLAKQGNPVAQYHLGIVYSQGLVILPNYPEATQWYLSSANKGYAPAQVKIGLMYAQGQWVNQDYKKAVQWFQNAADQNDASAQFNLGEMYGQGHGVIQDYYKSAQWYRLAANQSYALAQYKLGQAYVNGQGVTQDNEAALIWFNLAAANATDAVAYDKYIGQRDLTIKQIAAEKLAREQAAAAIEAKAKADAEQAAQAEAAKLKAEQAAEQAVPIAAEVTDKPAMNANQLMLIKTEPVVEKQVIAVKTVAKRKSLKSKVKRKVKSSRVAAKKTPDKVKKERKPPVNKGRSSVTAPKVVGGTVSGIAEVIPKIKAGHPVVIVSRAGQSPASATAPTVSKAADALVLSPDEAAQKK